MAQEKKSGGRFASLRTLREQRIEEPLEEQLESFQESEITRVEVSSPIAAKTDDDSLAVINLKSDTKEKVKVHTLAKQEQQEVVSQEITRKPGRPRGRRSNPDYTQISAYIPLDMLMAVQDALAEERKISRKRTPRPVSDLVEELLAEWLKKQITDKPRS
jgi:hypothetical protein